MDKNMTIEQFMERHDETLEAVAALDMSNLSSADYKMLMRMKEEQELLEMSGKDMTAFVACNINAMYPNGKDNWETLYSEQEAMKTLNLCTGGGNMGYLEAVAETIPNADIRDLVINTVNGLAEFRQVRNFLADENAKHEPTIADVQKGHHITTSILDSYNIPETAGHTEIFTDMRSIFTSAHLAGTTRSLLRNDVIRERTPEQLQELAVDLHVGGWKHDNERLQSAYHLCDKDTHTLRDYLKKIEAREAEQPVAESKWVLPKELQAEDSEPIISPDSNAAHADPDTYANDQQQSDVDPMANDLSITKLREAIAAVKAFEAERKELLDQISEISAIAKQQIHEQERRKETIDKLQAEIQEFSDFLHMLSYMDQ